MHEKLEPAIKKDSQMHILKVTMSKSLSFYYGFCTTAKLLPFEFAFTLQLTLYSMGCISTYPAHPFRHEDIVNMIHVFILIHVLNAMKVSNL